MKNFLLAALATLSFNSLSAQNDAQFIHKTNWMVGGRVMYSNKSQDLGTYDVKQNSFSVAPNVGYFAWDKLALGARLSYETQKTEINTSENKQTDFLFVPWVRYYFLPPVKAVNIFGEAYYGIGSSKDNDDEAESINKYGIESGLAWFCNPRVALEFFLGYRSSKFETDDERANTIYFGVGFQIHLDRCGGKVPQIQAKAH